MAKKPFVPVETPEWSFTVDVDDITDSIKHYKFEADEAERADLSRRFGIVSIESLTAQASVTPVSGAFFVQGELKVELTQTCVVTAEPVQNTLNESFEGWFADKMQTVSFAKIKKDSETKKSHSEVELLDEAEDPEPIVNGEIDLGELAAQHLSLVIDPYPRKPGVAHDLTDESEEGRKPLSGRKNPFEALKDWKEKR